MQEIINSEKEFIKSNSKSAQDFHKSAEALKNWAGTEGEDLQDVLGKLSLLFDSYGTAQNRLNAHLSTIRQHFKSVRTREEGLAELRARKRSLGSKIESVEKKLSKMGPENKELMKTTGQLKDLRGEMESLRIEVQTEEAAIGDYKRRAAKEAMGIKCGGLLELAEKLTIVAEVGKLMIEEISLEPTHPGMPRTDYLGAMRTDQLLQEATRGIADVGFAPGSGSTGAQRQDFTHRMRPSEVDDSMQGYYNSGNVTEEREMEDNGWNQEQEELASEHRNQADETYESAYDQQSLPPSNSGGYGADYRSAPIFAQHSSTSHGSQPVSVPAPLITQDTATDEWRRSRTAQPQPQATPVREMQTNKPASGTPIADQYASRSPDDIQVGGTGLHLIRSRSDDSVERSEIRPNGLHAAVSPLPATALSTPIAHHDSSEMYQPVPTIPMQPGSSTPPVPRQFSTPIEYGVGDEDEQYFQSVGSTRALQQAIRRPLSPGAAMSNTASASNSMTGHMASTPHEPQPEGRKMTAAAFRKGFGRVPSSQHQQHSAMGASTTSLGLGGANAAATATSGGGEAETAPLAIRKRTSVIPGQTAQTGDMATGDYPAPPYNAHHSIYGGLDNNDDMYAALPPPGPHGAAAWGSGPNSRPGSAAGYR